ncbi:hypothetical protein JCM17380_15990 [Desulfosporosinus burensis]
MKRNLKGMFNAVYNGDFQKLSKGRLQFPESWLQIGGNHETRWSFSPESTETFLEISNTTAIRAGVVQTQEASLNVEKEKEWLVTIVFKRSIPEAQAYLRLYPVLSNGDVSKPWEYSFRVGLEHEQQELHVQQEQFKQVISVGSNIHSLRLETGILGQGTFYLFKLIAYSLSPNRMKRRVIRLRPEIRQISSIQTIGEIIKPIQLAMPIPLKIPVTVQANVNADTRNLTPIRDRVQIYGSSQVPLATSISGRAQVEISGHGFHESLEDVTADQTRLFTTIRDVSALPRFSFAVYNFGTHHADVQAQLSPDGIHWALEGDQQKVEPKTLIIVTPKNFLRYIRLAYEAEGLTTLRIWVQAQN